MSALMHSRHDFDEHDFAEYEFAEHEFAEHEFAEHEVPEIEIGRAPARPRLALVGAPRAAVRCSPRTTRATYLRRRVLAVVVVLGILVAVGKVGATLGGSPLVTPERPPASQSADGYIVQPGDSLWSIAQALVPGSDPRPVVDELARARGDAPLRPGEVIRLRG